MMKVSIPKYWRNKKTKGIVTLRSLEFTDKGLFVTLKDHLGSIGKDSFYKEYEPYGCISENTSYPLTVELTNGIIMALQFLLAMIQHEDRPKDKLKCLDKAIYYLKYERDLIKEEIEK